MTVIGTTPTRLDARYRIEECIGAGGMATVYRGWDEELHRPVAIKVLNSGLAASPAFVERFKREASAAASVAHPNVVTVYDWGAHDGAYYIVMEFVPGLSLHAWMRQRETVSETEAVAICAQIATALEAIHALHLIHRDIKPHNVLLTDDGHVKVTDFGIAYAAGSEHLTTTNTVMGTAHYVSPEQVLRNPVDERTDIYSLGVLLYELLVGEPPFRGDSAVSVALQHAYDEPPSPRARRPEISPRAEEIVCTALAKDPARRFQSATAFKEVIEWAQAVPAPTMTLPLALTPRPASPPGTPVRDDPILPAPVRRSISRQARWLVAASLLLMVLAFGGHRLTSQSSGIPLSDITAASTVAAAPPAATATAARFPFVVQQAPTATPPPQPTATVAPTATAAPTITPAPMATPTAPPAPATPRVIVQAPRPQEAVLGFYYFVAAHQFDRAAALWSPSLQAKSPPAQAIAARYAQTTKITVQHWEVTSQKSPYATVAITILEYREGSDTPQKYTGTWNLVLADVGWLLDTQDMHPA